MHVLSMIGLAAILPCAAACVAVTSGMPDASQRGRMIYQKECASCHGPRGEGAGQASLGLGVPAPDLAGLTARNDGVFPREFVRRFVMGQLETDDPDAAMPDFSASGLRHVYPDGGADGEVLETDFEALLDYLALIQT